MRKVDTNKLAFDVGIQINSSMGAHTLLINKFDTSFAIHEPGEESVSNTG